MFISGTLTYAPEAEIELCENTAQCTLNKHKVCMMVL